MSGHSHTAIPERPTRAGTWTAQIAAAGTQRPRWTRDTAADRTVVAVKGDASEGLTVRASAGFSAPLLFELVTEMPVPAAGLATLSSALIVIQRRGTAACGLRPA